MHDAQPPVPTSHAFNAEYTDYCARLGQLVCQRDRAAAALASLDALIATVKADIDRTLVQHRVAEEFEAVPPSMRHVEPFVPLRPRDVDGMGG